MFGSPQTSRSNYKHCFCWKVKIRIDLLRNKIKQDRWRFDIFKFPVCSVIFNETMAKKAKTTNIPANCAVFTSYLRQHSRYLHRISSVSLLTVWYDRGGLQNMELQRCNCNSFKIALGVEYIVRTCFNLKFKNGFNILCVLMNNGFLSVWTSFIIHLENELKCYHFIAVWAIIKRNILQTEIIFKRFYSIYFCKIIWRKFEK